MTFGSSVFRAVPERDLGLQHFRYKSAHYFPERRLPEYAIVCCFSGQIDVLESSAQISLFPGEILIGNPGLLRGSQYLPVQGPCEGATVVVGLRTMQRLLEELRLVGPGEGAMILGKIHAPQIVGQLEKAVAVAGLGRSGSQSYLEGFLGQFLVEVLWNWPSAAIFPRQLQMGQLLSRRHFVHAVEYMNRCAKHEFAVESLCEDIGISVAHFRRLLYSSAQRSPLDFYNLVLVRRAQVMIGSDQSLKDVSYCLGFSTPSQFGKLFRHYTGVSPSEYQERRSVLQPEPQHLRSIISNGN
jgi:AraC-like DNA-binding protein